MSDHAKQKKGISINILKLFVPILFISGVYLYFVTEFLIKATDPACVEMNSSVSFSRLTISCKAMSPNEIGDYYAGLLAVLSTFWLVIAFAWQAMELRFQRDEFLKTNQLSAQRNKAEDRWHRIEFIAKMKKEAGEICAEIHDLLARYGLDVPNETSDFKLQLDFLMCAPQIEQLDRQLGVSIPQEIKSSYRSLLKRAKVVSKSIVLAADDAIVSETVGLS